MNRFSVLLRAFTANRRVDVLQIRQIDDGSRRDAVLPQPDGNAVERIAVQVARRAVDGIDDEHAFIAVQIAVTSFLAVECDVRKRLFQMLAEERLRFAVRHGDDVRLRRFVEHFAARQLFTPRLDHLAGLGRDIGNSADVNAHASTSIYWMRESPRTSSATTSRDEKQMMQVS